jgi:hypothetical protein
VLSAVDTTSVSSATISDAIDASARTHRCARLEACALFRMSLGPALLLKLIGR